MAVNILDRGFAGCDTVLSGVWFPTCRIHL